MKATPTGAEERTTRGALAVLSTADAAAGEVEVAGGLGVVVG